MMGSCGKGKQYEYLRFSDDEDKPLSYSMEDGNDSDRDSMGEYGGELDKYREDGSFIGDYRDRKNKTDSTV